MGLIELIRSVIEELFNYVYLFRVGWVITVLIGIAMLIFALVTRKKGYLGKMPWIVGGIGLLMTISSGTQLLFSMIL